VTAKPSPPASPTGKVGPGSIHAISSDALMAGRRVIIIRHGRLEYRLQVTGTGKLILTK
jgi:hemin uptake protein HemP